MAAVAGNPRRRNMQANKSRNTKPELTVRRALHSMGYRFRIHRNDLPGKPDIVLPRYKLAIFVHGCFWHQHAGCRLASRPSVRQEYWAEKFRKNRARDVQNQIMLEDQGWRVEVIWECQVRSGHVIERLEEILR